MRWKSIALWPDGVNVGCKYSGKNESHDFHDSREQALAVCRMIRREGLGGDPSIKPISTRVEEVKD
jgi:hypothetical protein